MDFLDFLFGKNKRKFKGDYLIEFRFHGYAKRYAKELSTDLSRRFEIKRIVRKGKPPHITLYGSFNTNDEKKLISSFAKVCKKQDLIKFKLIGFGHIDDRVVQLDVQPSEELNQFRLELVKELNPICKSQEWDAKEDFIFHTTLAFKDIENKFTKIWKYLEEIETPEIDQHLLRVTLLKRGKILKEYDLIQRKMMGRDEALSRKSLRRTIELLREIKENGNKRKTIEFVEEDKSGKNIFLISDLHLDHKNIIKYTNRPFRDVTEMNETILRNWNNVVKDEDTVYFLGDMAFGKGSREASYWLGKLKGNIIFIEGNHEETGRVKALTSAEDVFLNFKGKKFLLTHDPAIKPKNWNGWIIHGHKHNNHLEEFPLVNGENKTINLSIELIDYKPVEIGHIITEDLDKIKYWRTITEKKEYWG